MTLVRNTAPAGFDSAHFPVHPEDEASVIALYNSGLGDQQIAYKVHFTLPVLKGILERLVGEGRIKPRTPHRANAEPVIYRTPPQPSAAPRKHKTDWEVRA